MTEAVARGQYSSGLAPGGVSEAKGDFFDVA